LGEGGPGVGRGGRGRWVRHGACGDIVRHFLLCKRTCYAL
jgi:hypothetical protein